MKKLLDSFGLTTKEKRGFFVVLVLLGLLLMFPFVRSLLQSSEATPLPYTLVTFAEVEERVREGDRADEPQGLLSSATSNPPVGELFYFDPNGLPASSWRRLGLSDRQIRVIKNYESKGGKFYSKEDVKKLYSISEAFYQRIEPYIQIAHSREEKTIERIESGRSRERESGREVVLVDINSADTTAWKQLRGIGTVYANRIVRFREALGGFHHVEQLQEVYGVSEELYQQILPYLIVEEHSLRKIKINEVDKVLLQRHPYISPKQADIIIKYRHQHGAYTSLEEMRNIIVLDDDFLRKIEPYLDFDP